MHSVCPTCKRKMPVASGPDKKLAEDIAKAERAILLLKRWVDNPSQMYLGGEPTSEAGTQAFIQACKDEMMRLFRATQDTRLLASIYRHGDKKFIGYLEVAA